MVLRKQRAKTLALCAALGCLSACGGSSTPMPPPADGEGNGGFTGDGAGDGSGDMFTADDGAYDGLGGHDMVGDGRPGDDAHPGDQAGDRADDGSADTDLTLPGYRLVFHDEFDVPGLPDASKWNFEDQRPGWVNNELQNYVPGRLDNARVENGVLIIEAHRDDYNGHEYSSARIHSAGKGEFTYGRVVARARVPSGRGTWPAIWMMPADVFKYATTCNAQTGWINGCNAWPNSGEIDILEHVGYEPNVVHATIHCEAYNWRQAEQKTASTSVPTATTEFHEYMVERTPDSIEAFVDGRSYFRYDNPRQGPSSWPFDQPFYVIINLAVGGDWGGAMGVDANVFPQRLEVDYVRMYERE